MRVVAAMMCALVLGSGSARADEAEDRQVSGARAPIRDLAPMVVSGVQPGPGMWKVVAADGHVMWVLGVVRPLPTDMIWQSDAVEAAIAGAGQVLDAPRLHVAADTGFFESLTLLPAAWRMHRNPDGARLDDLLPEAGYRSWREQKKKYLGVEWGIERWRPGFAADKLYNAALEQHGLGGGVIDPVIRQASEQAGLEPTPVQLSMQIEEPRALMKEFSRTPIDDVACMQRTLVRLEQGLDPLVARANAWATGDIDTLRGLHDERVSCLQEMLDGEFARQHGFADMEQKVRGLWLETAEQALADNAVTFALLPMEELLADGGYLAELVARGYRVEAPAGATPAPVAVP